MPSTVSDVKVVFVMGSPRSGTTLLQKVIESHDNFFSIQGETGIFSYQNIFDTNRRHFGLDSNQQTELLNASKDIVDFFDKSVKLISINNEGKTFVEKTPQHVIYLAKLVKYFPNARFVNIVRDGRDCFCSAKHHKNIPQRRSVDTFANYWKKCVLPPLLLKTNENIFTVRYEDFAGNPSDELSRLMLFLNDEIMQKQLDPNVYGNDRRASNKNYKKLNESINTSSVSRWKQELNDREKAAFIDIAGDELSAYGYEV